MAEKTTAKQKEPKIKATEYTAEQLETVKKINKCRDYYQILGVKKDATNSQIKKAYKKLALLTHPDKNKCPGATEAFKAIGNAVEVLTNVEKRKEYDLYGPEDKIVTARTQQYNSYQEFDSDDMKEFFRIFKRYQQNNTASHHTYREKKLPHKYYPPILQLVLMIILLMASYFFTSNPYSLEPNLKYPVSRTTFNREVPYYVKETFATEYQGLVRRLEMSVEEDYISNLKLSCKRERKKRDAEIWRAQSSDDKILLQAAQKMKVPSCGKLHSLHVY